VKKGAKLGKKGPKKSINRGGQLIFTIATWKLTKSQKKPFVKKVNSGSYGGRKTLLLGPSKYKFPLLHLIYSFVFNF
jgi:hypothetical protein